MLPPPLLPAALRSNVFRRERLYTPGVDATLRSHLHLLWVVYHDLLEEEPSRQLHQSPPQPQRGLCLTTWLRFLKRFLLLGNYFTPTDATVVFAASRMLDGGLPPCTTSLLDELFDELLVISPLSSFRILPTPHA